MKRSINALVVCLLMLVSSTYSATTKQKKMVRLIDSVSDVYDSMYAPALWKKEFANWSLAAQVAIAKEQVLSKELTTQEFQKVLNQFVLSMKDFHVSMRFFATERATLPIKVRGVAGKYFLVHIDRTKLPQASFPFSVGDEIIKLGGDSIHKIVTDIKSLLGGNTEVTDQALAEMMLTSRSARSAMSVPQGPVTLVFKKNDKEVSHQLIWEHTQEVVSSHNSNQKKSYKFKNDESKISIDELNMSVELPVGMLASSNSKNGFAIGAKKSFLPSLGTKIWESDKESSFDAYIYMNSKKELVGYIRIKSYGAGEKESLEFKEIMKKFSKTTDKLVIDQLNNPGGSVFYLYSLVSMLTDKPMATPKHYMAINQEMVFGANKSLKDMEKIKNQADLHKAFGAKTIGGYPLDMNFLEFMKVYYRFIMSEWNEGKTLTKPHHLYGVDHINPHPEVKYTKPILLLVNELDFSGGDFFPAIMQDNKRATIMGVRTAGAGGYVNSVKIPNQFGVQSFSFTASLADRVDNTPIENLGVTPDVDLTLTVNDFKNNFRDYVKKIKEQINKM